MTAEEINPNNFHPTNESNSDNPKNLSYPETTSFAPLQDTKPVESYLEISPAPEVKLEDTQKNKGVLAYSPSIEPSEKGLETLPTDGMDHEVIQGHEGFYSITASPLEDPISIEVKTVSDGTHKKLFAFLSILFVNILILISVTRPSLQQKSTASEITTDKPEMAVPIILNPEPEINAHAYIVKIIGQNRPILARREWKPLPPASLTKILTTVLAEEILLPEDQMTFSEEDKKTEEKLSPIKKGETVLRDQAMALALVSSFNDAALAIAENIGKRRGGINFEERLNIFKALLNEKANSLGLFDSEFQNPVGLDEDGHYSSAEDLTKLAEYVWLNHPDIWEISRQIEMTVKTEEGSIYQINNTDELLKEFPAILGSKTGFTEKARGAFLFLYPVRPDKTAIIVILGSEDRFGDGRKIIQWLEGNLK